jgi:hypothetical protein
MTRIRASKLFILSSINFLITFSMIFTNTIKAEVNGRMIITSITSEKVSVLLQLNTSAASDAMGGATMVIGFDTSSISFKANPVKNTDYTFHNFCGGNYSSATITRPFSNRIWINIDLPFDHVNNGTVVEGGNNWTDVVTINFDVKNSHGFASVFWITNSVFWGIYDDNNITFWNTGQFRDVTNIPLPVELTSFTATIKKDKVFIEWLTMTEVDNYGFDIERSVNNSEWEKIVFVKGSGNSNSQKSYSFVDDQLTGGTEFRYRLKQINTDGSFEFSRIVEAHYFPHTIELFQNYPNPFNPTTVIEYQIPQSSFVSLKAFDALGNEVATLVNEEKSTGIYKVKFDATHLSSGIYFYKLQSGNFIETKKMVLIK